MCLADKNQINIDVDCNKYKQTNSFIKCNELLFTDDNNNNTTITEAAATKK